MNTIKTLFLICVCLTALSWRVIGQSPAAAQMAAAQASPVSPSASVSPASAVSPSPAESDLEQSIKKKAKRHFHINIGDNDGETDTGHISHRSHNSDDIPEMAIPIIAIVMLTVFGTPVVIVGLIMYFSFSKSRAMHRTVRMMVEKGQPVPEALLNPPPVIRQRSDLRRGVTLLMVGTGLMIFFGACNDWEGGAWSLGMIPFLIGLGYILVWRLDVRKGDSALPKEDASPRV